MAYEPPSCECFRALVDRVEQLQAIYCKQDAQLVALLDIVDNTGGGSGATTFTSNPQRITGALSIPIGTLGWSVTAISGTVTVALQALPAGATVGGGGYGSKTLAAAVAVDATGGVAWVNYDN